MGRKGMIRGGNLDGKFREERKWREKEWWRKEVSWLSSVVQKRKNVMNLYDFQIRSRVANYQNTPCPWQITI